jgi:hypothetical protein
MNLMIISVMYLSALDAAKKLLVRPIIALIAVTNTSLGMAKSYKFNT